MPEEIIPIFYATMIGTLILFIYRVYKEVDSCSVENKNNICKHKKEKIDPKDGESYNLCKQCRKRYYSTHVEMY